MIPNSFIVFCPGDLNMISITEIGLLHHCFSSPFTVFSDSLVFGNWDFTLPPFYFLSPLIISETFLAWFWQHLEMKLTVAIMSTQFGLGAACLTFFLAWQCPLYLHMLFRAFEDQKYPWNLRVSKGNDEDLSPLSVHPKGWQGHGVRGHSSPSWCGAIGQGGRFLAGSLPSVSVDCHTLYTDSGGADGGSEIPLYFGRGRRSGGGRRESERGSLNQ